MSRFEIVSAPLEQALSNTLEAQAALLLAHLNSASNQSHELLANKELRQQIAKSGTALLLRGIPGAFFAAAALLRVVRWASIHLVVASMFRAPSKAKSV